MTPKQAAQTLGRLGGLKGGKSRSKAKQAAARRNGAKGGRKPLDKAKAKVRKITTSAAREAGRNNKQTRQHK